MGYVVFVPHFRGVVGKRGVKPEMKMHATIQERLQSQEVHGEKERLAGWFKNRISLLTGMEYLVPDS